ncbi:MAG: NUDIX hydrolase [Planctomycetota bacterium]|nr:MAG: NUDIX hydrolase [Planctomycetota bacterium]
MLLETSRFRVVRLQYLLRNGHLHQREVIQHPGAVVVVPILDDGAVCLIRNYRVAVDRTLLEFPAGTLEPGEDPLHTARRELQEEAGFRSGQIEPLGEFYMSPGILDERMRVFVARRLEAGPPALEAGEEIEPVLMGCRDVDRLIAQGEILDAKTIAAWCLFQRSSNASGSAVDHT